MFSYTSGREISVEAAVRMNILTGANQTAAKIIEETMREMGASLVRTSAHLGARNTDVDGKPWANHESWQGKVFHWKEMDSGENKLTNPHDNDTITPNNDNKVSDVQNVGTIDLEKYRDISANILTDEVVITDKQLSHILSKRADTYKKYRDKFSEILNDPDYIFDDPKHPDTALVVKRYDNAAEVVLRLSTESVEKKNSIITMWEIKEPRLKRYILTHKTVYKKE